MPDPVHSGEQTSERYTVRSLARALGVLELLGTPQASQGLGVSEIADRIGLSKSATFAILHTLLGAGFVSDSGTGQQRRYFLGMALARLGAQASATRSVTDFARPVLSELADELHSSVRLGAANRRTVEVIERVDSPSGIRIDLRMGKQELLHCTAIGKAIMAHWDDQKILRALGDGPLERRTEQTLTDPRDVLAELRTVRTRGYAVDDEEDFAGILCIGVAIEIPGEQTTWGISTTTLKATVTYDKVRSIANVLMAGARKIELAVAGSGGGDPAKAEQP